jgi:predicted nuclease of predicted toxin-antitoxin system
VYVIDTSALLDGWIRYYPADVFPSLWSQLEEMIKTGELVSPDEVLLELGQKDDEIRKWAKANSTMFVPLDEDIQNATQEILIQFPRLVGAMKDRNRADPFVIALAKVKDAIVVTGEKSSGTGDRPRIPNVCDHFGISHRTLLQLIRDKGWTFR